MTPEEIRQNKMQELMQRQEADTQKDAVLKQILTPEAKARLTTLKLANPELASQVESLVIYIYQSGQMKTIDDETLKKILVKIKGTKREITIKRK